MRQDHEPEDAAPQNVALPKKAVSHRYRLDLGYLQQTLFAQACVFSTERQQLVVGAALDDATVIEHQNLIGVHDGREAMRDDD